MDTTHRLALHLAGRISAQWPDGPGCLLIGVSGGADSVCLLHLLAQVSRKVGFRLHAIHVHHGIRGKDADADMAFVSDLCARIHVPFLGVHVDAPALAGKEKLSLEDAARRLRYEAMRDAADCLGAVAIVLAHHRDDQAETVLMHLLRGAASEGLCGMHVLREGLFRPMLDCPAMELRACLAENAWEWREDASNLDVAYRRNALRHRWMPLLREHLGQDPAGPLVRFATIQRQEQEYLSSLAIEAADQVRLTGTCTPSEGSGDPESSSDPEGRSDLAGSADMAGSDAPAGSLKVGTAPAEPSREGVASFDAKALCGLPEVLARRVVFLAWKRATGNRNDMGTVHAEAVVGLCRSGRAGSAVSLPGKMEARLDGQWCRMASSDSFHNPHDPDEEAGQKRPWQRSISWPAELGETRKTSVPEAAGSLLVKRISLEEAQTAYESIIRGKEAQRSQLIDSSRASEGLRIRNRMPGDVFRPWNAPGGLKLKEWFINRKIPLAERDAIPLLASGNQVLWVIGHRTAQDLCGTGQDATLYEMTWISDSDTADLSITKCKAASDM
jgi:tRNA(Ile)-lysidine synthase